MRLAHGLVAVGDQVQLTHHGLHLVLTDALDHRFVGAAIGDQVGDGADLQAMLASKLDQVRQARHGAVFLHDLADHGGRREARQCPQVTAGLGVAGACQHATGTRHDGEDVARLHDVGRLGIRGHGGLDGACPVGRRDAGGHAFGRLDGHREVGAHLGAVDGRHQRQPQSAATLFRQRQTDQAPRMAGHEVDGLGRDEVGRDQQVAFVLAVLVIDQDDHLARTEVRQDLGGACHGRQHLVLGHVYLLRVCAFFLNSVRAACQPPPASVPGSGPPCRFPG